MEETYSDNLIKEKRSICYLRRRMKMPCKDCIYFEQPICRKTFKAKEKKEHESTGEESQQ